MAEHANNISAAASAQIIPFDFEGHGVRIVDRGGSLWFVGNDICSVLGIADPRQALEKLDYDERGRCSIPTPSGGQEMRIVSEGGLYTLILRSRDATTPGTLSHRFRKWVTGTVLPTIRKTGGYRTDIPIDPMQVLNDPAAMRGLLLTYTEKVLELEKANAQLTPKAEAHDRIAVSFGSVCRRIAAKNLGIPPLTLNRWMRTNGWTYRLLGASDDLAYQAKMAAGLLEHKVETGDKADGTTWTRTQVRVTPKGMLALAKAFPPAVKEAV